MDVVILNGGMKQWKDALFARSIGPYKIAHWLRKHNISCQVIDFVTGMSHEQLYQVLEHFISDTTKVLAISTTFLCNSWYEHSDGTQQRIPQHVLECVKILKKRYAGLKVILGGYGSDGLPNWGVVDATIMTYTAASEDIFLEFIHYLNDYGPEPYGSVKYVLKNGERVVYTAARNPRYSIEEDDFNFSEQDCILPGESLPLDISRGCIFACKFCQFTHLGKSKFDYVRGMQKIQQELLSNYAKWGTTNYFILDDTFNDSPWKVESFYEMIQELPFKIKFAAYIRADLLHRFPDTAVQLKTSGLCGAFHGLETLHPDSSQLIGKGWSGKHARDFIPELYHNIWQGSVAQNLSFIVGLPNDTRDSLQSTIDWYSQNNLHCLQINPLFLVGKNDILHSIQSEFDRNAEKYGYVFLDKQNVPGGVSWSNGEWTSENSTVFATELLSQISTKNKLTMWLTLGLEGFGYEHALLFSTPSSKLPWVDFRQQTRVKYQEYWQMLMDIK